MKKLICLAFFAAALWAPLAVSLFAVPSTTLVISEFRVRGERGGNDEFVELYNRSSGIVDISGWKVRGSNASGTVSTRATIPLGTTLGPGCYYLLTNTAANGYSGAVPGNLTYGVGVTDDGGIALTRANDSIVDEVGLSSGSAFREGTPLASLGNTSASNLNRGYERNPGGVAGHDDTDNNASDFRLLEPSNPQRASPACLGQTNPVIDASATPNPVIRFETLLVRARVSPGGNPPSTNLAATADLAVLGGIDNQPLFDDGSNGDVTAGDGTYSYLLAVTADAGTYAITADVTDAQGRSGTDSFSVTVQPTPPLLLPHQIQGADTASDYVTQIVAVEGVVTARRSNGVFIETEAGREDGIAETSEGLFVFTRSAPPPAATVGTLIRAIGPVEEFSGDGLAQTQTEVADSPTFAIRIAALGTGIVAPPALLTSATLAPNEGFDQLERFEGMRIFTPSLTTVSGTDGFFATSTGGEGSGVVTSSGVFYAVLTPTARPVREPGLDLPLQSAFENRCASGPPCAIPIFDFNPERLRVDSDALGAPRLDVTSNATIQNVTAIVDSGFINWSLLPVRDALPAPIVGANMTGSGVSAALASQFTVASFNVQRFYDTTNDAESDVPLTAENYAARLQKASLVIRSALRAPDVIALQEVEKLSVLQDLANEINADLAMPGEYTAYLEEGNDPGGIDVGFLVRARVHVTSVVQEGKNTTFTDPDDGSADSLNDRPPLVLRATVDGPSTMLDAQIIVVANHLRSLGGVESTTSDRVRVKRQLQAEFLAELVDNLQAEGPVISVGDYNAFEESDGLVDVMGTVRGTPAPANEVVLASPDLVNPDFAEAAPGTYSYVFEGNIQTLDHVLLSTDAAERFVRLEHARINADFPEIYRQDPSRIERLSDHDPAIAYFSFPPDLTPPSIAAVTPSVASLGPLDHRMHPISLSVDATDDLGLSACVVTGVSSNEPANGVGDGNTTTDWSIDGPLSVSLRAERSGTGSGRIYTIVVTCTDVAGNTSAASATVAVAHNRRK
jgi:predicted extracellular nuclease